MAFVPESNLPIVQASVQTSNPVSESSLNALAGAINFLLKNADNVGDVKTSCLDETTFQGVHGTTWVLMDGRDVTGSRFQSLTGLANIPDARGTVLRGKDNGRGLDPHGDQAIGTYQADQMLEHKHDLGFGVIGYGDPFGSPGTSFFAVNGNGESFTTPRPYVGPPDPNNAGGATTSPTETNAKGTVLNFFVKINV